MLRKGLTHQDQLRLRNLTSDQVKSMKFTGATQQSLPGAYEVIIELVDGSTFPPLYFHSHELYPEYEKFYDEKYCLRFTEDIEAMKNILSGEPKRPEYGKL